MSRQDQYAVALVVDGVNLGIWDTQTGGLADSEELKHRSGGMGPQMAYGGPQTVENVTLTKKYDLYVDLPRRAWLESRRGRGQAVVIKQTLDADGARFGQPEVWTGVLKSVKTPDVDANSADAGMLEVEISTHGIKA